MLCSRIVCEIALCITLWFSEENLGNAYQFENGASLSVVNGTKANIKNFPITAAFLISNDIWGAGAIYNKNWIVTTAFNCHWVDPKYMGVRVGSSNWTEGGQLLGVDRCVLHPAYDPSTGAHNVAMARLRGGVDTGTGTHARAALMPDAPAPDFAGQDFAVAGWGVRSKKFIKETWLQMSIQRLLTQSECSAKYNLTVTSICAYNATSSPCMFDFGAPLMSKRTLIGLYDGSKDCTEPSVNPSVYVEIYPYKEWLKNVAKSN